MHKPHVLGRRAYGMEGLWRAYDRLGRAEGLTVATKAA